MAASPADAVAPAATRPVYLMVECFTTRGVRVCGRETVGAQRLPLLAAFAQNCPRVLKAVDERGWCARPAAAAVHRARSLTPRGAAGCAQVLRCLRLGGACHQYLPKVWVAAAHRLRHAVRARPFARRMTAAPIAADGTSSEPSSPTSRLPAFRAMSSAMPTASSSPNRSLSVRARFSSKAQRLPAHRTHLCIRQIPCRLR